MADNHDKNEELEAEEEQDDLEDFENEEEEDEEEEDDAEEDEEEDKDEDDEEDDDKPLTRKDLKRIIDSRFKKQRKENPQKRHDSKKNYQPNRKDGGDKNVITRLSAIEEFTRRQDFAEEHGLTRKETNLVFQFDPNPTAKTLRNSFVKGGLERLREKEALKRNIPHGGNPKISKFNGKEWKDLKEDEKQSSFQERRQQILDRKRGR